MIQYASPSFLETHAVIGLSLVHRTLANRAKVLHRDMSINNILMYPRWAQATNAQVLEGIPPFIDDVLDRELRSAFVHWDLLLAMT